MYGYYCLGCTYYMKNNAKSHFVFIRLPDMPESSRQSAGAAAVPVFYGLFLLSGIVSPFSMHV